MIDLQFFSDIQSACTTYSDTGVCLSKLIIKSEFRGCCTRTICCQVHLYNSKIMTLMSRSTRKVILFCASHLTQLTSNQVQMIHPVAFCPYALHTLAKRAITIGPSSFLPQKVVLMRKVTRYEYEKHHFPSDKEEEFQKHVRFFSIIVMKIYKYTFYLYLFCFGV